MPQGDSSESDWVRSAVGRYERPLLAYALRVCGGDVERARDVVQETFVRLCEQEQSKVEAYLAQWLFTVCRRRALDVVKKEARVRPLSESEWKEQASGEPSPAAQLEQREDAGEVLNVLATLPQNQQEVIRLKFQSGLSYQEISKVTSLSVSNVGFLIHTAIKTIRQRLQVNSVLVPYAVRRIS